MSHSESTVQAQQHYAGVFDSLLDIILVVHRDGRILYGNQMAVKTYGYAPEELTKRSIYDLRQEDAREQTGAQLNEAWCTGTAFYTRHTRRNGSSFPVSVRSVRSDLRPDEVISIVRDMTEYRAMADQARLFSMAMEICDDAVIVFSKDYRITLWSRGAEKRFGYREEEVLGQPFDILVPEDKRQAFFDKTGLVASGGMVRNIETQRRHKNGALLDVSISYAPVTDCAGQYSGTLAVYKDISEKIRLDEALKAYEQRSRIAMEGAQFGVWELHIQEGVLEIHNGMHTVLGFDAPEDSVSLRWLREQVHPDDRDMLRNAYLAHLEGQAFAVEVRMFQRTGEMRWRRIKGRVAAWDTQGQPLSMFGTAEDITDRKHVELELQEKLLQLEFLRSEAEAASQAKTQFLDNISHEIRTPLNGVMSAVQLMEASCDKPGHSKYRRILRESADSLNHIVTDLLDVSSIEKGRVLLKDEPVNLRELVSDLYSRLMMMAHAQGLETVFFMDPAADMQVSGDEARIKQIISNLLSNAVKFTETGFVSLRVAVLRQNDLEGVFEFRVRDSGIGIAPEAGNRIFQRFHQEHSGNTKRYAGNGLGLAIAKQLASAMGGTLTYESVPGQGSVFVFTCSLRKAVADTGVTGRPVPPVKDRSGGLRILCVEDNVINQSVIERILLRRGDIWIPAYDWRDALKAMEETLPDLILMDIQLPEKNGYEVTDMLRKHSPQAEHIPVIAMTAYAKYEDREKCLAAGMQAYTAKPLDIHEFNVLLDDMAAGMIKKAQAAPEG